jgi:penicillin-binding protein 1A
MTAAYSPFVNRGVYSKTRSYYEVLGADGTSVLENKYDGEAIISEETASVMTLMMENVVGYGTAKDIKLKKHVECAGKTGSTQNNCDKWFIGYTPHFIGGIWCGYEYPESMDKIEGNPCVTVWDEIMTILYNKNKYNVNRFEIGKDIIKVQCCLDSGKLLTSVCRIDARGSRGVWCYFESGTEPNEYCDCHVAVEYNKKDGGIACTYCSVNDIEKVGLIKVYRDFPMQVYIEDAQYVWRKMPFNSTVSHDEKIPFFSDIIKHGRYCGISRGTVQFNSGCRSLHWE